MYVIEVYPTTSVPPCTPVYVPMNENFVQLVNGELTGVFSNVVSI